MVKKQRFMVRATRSHTQKKQTTKRLQNLWNQFWFQKKWLKIILHTVIWILRSKQARQKFADGSRLKLETRLFLLEKQKLAK